MKAKTTEKYKYFLKKSRKSLKELLPSHHTGLFDKA